MTTQKTGRRVFFLLVFIFSCSASGIYASTDCSRWVAEYKQALLQKRAVRRVLAARNRIHHYAQHRLVGLVVHPHGPLPGGVHRIPLRPKMGPLDALRRFELDCGELPVPSRTLPPTAPFEITDTPGTGLLPPDADVPPIELAQVDYPVFPGVPPLIPPIGLGQVPVIEPPSVAIPVPISAPAPVPEPGTLLLVLTGIGGAATHIFRRTRLS